MLARRHAFMDFRLVLCLILVMVIVPVQGTRGALDYGGRFENVPVQDKRLEHLIPLRKREPFMWQRAESRLGQSVERHAFEPTASLTTSLTSPRSVEAVVLDPQSPLSIPVHLELSRMQAYRAVERETKASVISIAKEPFSLARFPGPPEASQSVTSFKVQHLADALERGINPMPLSSGSVLCRQGTQAVVTTTQTLKNPGFETGTWTPWIAVANAKLVNDIQYTGDWAAHLGNTNDAFDIFWQTIDIPADATEVSFDFWTSLETQELLTGYDFLYTLISDPSGSTLYVVAGLDFGNVSGGFLNWTRMSYTLDTTELLSVTGKTVDLNFVVSTDEISAPSRAWVDDVGLYITTPAITINPTTIRSGETVTVTGSGFHKDSVTTISLDNVIEGTTIADPSGNFTYTLATAPDISAGDHVVYANDDEGASAKADLIVRGLREVSITPGTGPTGTLFTITGHHFVPPAGSVILPRVVTLTVDSALIGRGYANAQGAFTTTYTPTNLTVGWHTLLADDGDGQAQTMFYITPLPDCTVASAVDSGPDTLRQCLLDAIPGDYITFDPLIFPPSQPLTIALLSPLPYIVTDSLILDGGNAGVVLDGHELSEGDGLIISATHDVQIMGLQMVRFPRASIIIRDGSTHTIIGGDRAIGEGLLGQGNLLSDNGQAGVIIHGARTAENQVLGNYIGTDPSGMIAHGNGIMGVAIIHGAMTNTIGGLTPSTHNLISGNADTGVWIQDGGTSGNLVMGNYIGTDISGAQALGNATGVFIGFEATGNVIGGHTPEARNLIGGNTMDGVVFQSAGTTDNKVIGNYIGTDATGTTAVGNGSMGILIHLGAAGNIIGGDKPGAGNLISGNGESGIWLQDKGTSKNQVLGNYIGVNISGTYALGNQTGITILGKASNNVIGGEVDGARNIISGNYGDGLWLQDEGTDGNQIIGNYIGLDTRGIITVGNGSQGIFIWEATNSIIGGYTAGARNVISGNGEDGIKIQSEGTTGNHVLGNYIGTDVSGAYALENGANGVLLIGGAVDNTIGGDVERARNLISANNLAGISLQDEGTTGNRILGNYIGLNINGTYTLGNQFGGVLIGWGAADNILGGETKGARNVVSGNNWGGVVLMGVGTSGNQVLGNYVGTDLSGTIAFGNDKAGIDITLGAANNLIGGVSEGTRNVISGNDGPGITLSNEGTTGNQMLGNYIGTDARGIHVLGNTAGIYITSGAADNIIGGSISGERNLISGNEEAGILLSGENTTRNQILGNYIGTNVRGTVALGNEVGVALILGAVDNVIGGVVDGARNLISGNTLNGIWLSDEGTSNNQILGNYIGTDITGTQALGNAGDGISIVDGAANNVIGSDTEGGRNLISGNYRAGVSMVYEGTTGNQVLGNYIGTDADGMFALANGHGIMIVRGASNNIIGGDISNARNLISGNFYGIWVENDETTGNRILGNYIGVDADGFARLGNTYGGVVIGHGASDNVVGGGTSAAGNFIGGNGITGVWLWNDRTMHNTVANNRIVTNTIYGVYLQNGASANTIGISNTIAYNMLGGVVISGTTTEENTITRNSIYDNGGPAIDFINVPFVVEWYFAPTQCSESGLLSVRGQVCAGCQIELYGNPTPVLEGAKFLGDAKAGADGRFSLNITCEPWLPYLAATVTEPDGTTSKFFAGGSPPPKHTVFLPLVVRE